MVRHELAQNQDTSKYKLFIGKLLEKIFQIGGILGLHPTTQDQANFAPAGGTVEAVLLNFG